LSGNNDYKATITEWNAKVAGMVEHFCRSLTRLFDEKQLCDKKLIYFLQQGKFNAAL
jgi:hypothetical protein